MRRYVAEAAIRAMRIATTARDQTIALISIA